MMIETILEDFPKEVALKNNQRCCLRPLTATDEPVFFEFFQAVPENERMFIKHRVTDRAVIMEWCQNIDYGRNLPILAFDQNRIVGVSTLHQQLGGWKRHVGRISVLVHPDFRGRGLASTLVNEIIHIARHIGLERIEAEFIGGQSAAIQMFGLLGFTTLVRLPDHVKDMQAVSHDYILMGFDLETDEEYASAG